MSGTGAGAIIAARRKPKSLSPTQRCLAECRKRGWTAQVVERWNPHAMVRVDLFGCIDIVALDGKPGVLGIQACARSSAAARMTKAREEPKMAVWIEAGNRFEVWSWATMGKVGKRKLWTLKVEGLE